jgi:acyl-CoA thioester hydrolase
MEKFTLPVQIRWSDIDQNRHLRHSIYYDYGAMMRMALLSSGGLTTQKLEELKIGPILFREEAIFRREVKLEDKIILDAVVLKSTRDYGRWSLRHNIVREDGTVCAIITVDGAWIDIEKRKLAIPSEFIRGAFEKFPKAEDFQWVEPSQPK